MDSWGVADLQEAIEEGHFTYHFQPRIDLRTSATTGFEALARWRHRTLGFISPDRFIPALERAGLSEAFTNRMLRDVFAAWRHSLPKSSTLSINMCATQIACDSLPDRVRAISEEEEFALDHLIVEITEDALLEHPAQARICADALKTFGVRLAFDDFGTGHSSLQHLRMLPFDEMKIDRSFTGSMVDDPDCKKLVAAMIGIGHTLGLSTVAVGIENWAQAAMLIRMGCDEGQGWLYGKPVPVEQMAPIILAGSIAHEIKQPITSIVTNATFSLRQLGKSNPDITEVRAALEDVVESANRANSIVSRIRGLFLNEAPVRVSFDVNDLIRETVDLVRAEADENFITVDLELADPSPVVEGDSIQLQQALLNVLINSIEALRSVSADERHLTIRSFRSAGAIVQIKDSGPGIPPTVSEHVFEPYFTTKTEGMGLGLSISRSIMHAHGGHLVNIPTAPGALFEFIFPPNGPQEPTHLRASGATMNGLSSEGARFVHTSPRDPERK